MHASTVLRAWSRREFAALLFLCVGFACIQPDDALETAQRELAAGRVSEAIELLRMSLAKSPDEPALNLEYGKALLAAGQPSLAVWSLSKARRSEPYQIEAATFLARAQSAVGSHDEAAATLEDVLRLDKNNLAALRMKVENSLEARKPEIAIETVDYALDLAPDDLGLLMSRMRILLTLDEGDEAGEMLPAIRERLLEASDIPQRERLYLSGRYCAIEAMFTHEDGDSEQAKELFTHCLEEYPTHDQVVTSAANFFDQIGSPDRATSAYHAALDAEPKNLNRRVALATRLASLNREEEARVLLLGATEEQPMAWSALVDHFLEHGTRQQALEALENALEYAGNNAPPDWRLQKADLLIQEARLDEAEIAIGLIGEPVYEATARGRLELSRGNPGRALQFLDQGIRLWPDGTMARYLAAQAAEELGDFERAESEYREAYRSDQTYTDAGLKLAALLSSRGLPGDAADLALAFAGADPTDHRGFEAGINYALMANRAEMASKALAHYQNQPVHRARARAFAARYLMNAGRTKEAERLVKSLKLDLSETANLELLQVNFELQMVRHEYGAAESLLDTIPAGSPNHLSAQILRGRLLETKGYTSAAEAIYREILEVDPEEFVALLALARIDAASRKPSAAIAALEEASRVAPTDVDRARATFIAAGLLKDVAQREVWLRRTLRHDPRHAEAAHELAELLATQNGDPELISDLRAREKRFSR